MVTNLEVRQEGLRLNHKEHQVESLKEGARDPFAGLRRKLTEYAKRAKSLRLARWTRQVASVVEPISSVTMRRVSSSDSPGECREITVMSANLWHDWPRFRNIETRLESFARLVEQEGAEIVLLQEVARTRDFHVDSLLAERLKMSYVYSRSNGSATIGFEEGLGIFSRFPLLRTPLLRQVSRMANPFVRRMALGVEVMTPCGEILAFSVHLGLLRHPNARQQDELRHWIGQLTGLKSAVIGGDFNASDKSRRIRRLKSHWQDTFSLAEIQGLSHTHTLRWPWGARLLNHRIDYIFLQPGKPEWTVKEVHHLDTPGQAYSDHRAVVARLTPSFSA
jgi:endonuclease/exonuclease/phosphatase family metal-dependent hydrolase